jgi:hypothetical protein
MIQTQCVPNRTKTFLDIGSTDFQDVLVQGSTIFQKITEPPKNSRRLQGNMKQVPYCGPTNIRLHRTKYGRPGFVRPRRSIYIRQIRSSRLDARTFTTGSINHQVL